MTEPLDLLLENIRQEATRLQSDGLDVDAAWLDAIVTVVKRTAEGKALDALELEVIAELRRAERDFGNKPVPTMALAVRLGIDDRIRMWRILSSLESRGLVYRPYGTNSKAGYRATA